MPANVDWDVAKLTRDFIANNWGTAPSSTTASQPANIVLLAEDGKGVDYTEEYVQVVETGERDQEYIDGPRDVKDVEATAMLEASTPQSRTRREEIWSELVALAEYARKRSEATPGNWDTVTVQASPVDDETFNWWSLEMVWRYRAEARTL